MPEVIGSIALCSSPFSLVCDEQGIGNFPLWKRYKQLSCVVTRHIPTQYQSFFARPVAVQELDDNHIVWYAETDTDARPQRLTQLDEENRNKYQRIKDETISAYNAAIETCISSGENSDAEYLTKAMKYVGDFDDYFYCFDDKVVVVVWGMRPRATADPQRCVIDKLLQPNQSFKVIFDLGEHGTSSSDLELYKRVNDNPIDTHQVPQVKPLEGYRFTGWNADPIGHKVTEDITFVAQYEKLPTTPAIPITEPNPPQHRNHTVRFEDEHGNELATCSVNDGDRIPLSAIPPVPNKDNYKFAGWGNDLQTPVHEDRTYRLHYDKIPLSWWNRFKLWWTEKGCLKWLLRFLLFLLLLLLLILLLRNCNGCSRHKSYPYNGGNPFQPIDSSNNASQSNECSLVYPPINPDDPGTEYLPERPNKPIPIDDGDIIDDEDGYRKIVANRLNVLLDDDNLSITDFANDFKKIYPQDKYQIIYADPIVKRLQLQVPADERGKIKNELISKLPEKYNSENVFVWDEALITLSAVSDDKLISNCDFHKTIKTFAAWDITKGSSDITIAVVDDGFNVEHEDLRGKIVKPYNVYTQTSDVGESYTRHGTHVAGLATATADNKKGIAGVAPNCKLMPIKVADTHGNIGLMAVLDGVLCAVYNGADVINLSLGMDINVDLPIQAQKELIHNYFKEEERVWKKVFSIAERNNTVIVIAAGNNNLLAGIEPMHRSEDVIVVAAVDDKNLSPYNKADFSNYGSFTDVSAPGNDLLSTVGSNAYTRMSGTSMAAPLVAGAVALIKSVNRPLSTTKIKRILQETGLEVNGNIGNLIQLDKALKAAQNTSVKTIDTHPTPSTGVVQIMLEWSNYNDLDLICLDPNGDDIWYQQKKVPSGGILEIDMNAGDVYSSSPIENIYWPNAEAPKGTYHVLVLYYKRHDTHNASSNYKVTIRYGNENRSYSGTATTEGELIEICSFNVK